MFWGWAALAQVTAEHLEHAAMARSRRLRHGEHFSLTDWISDALLHEHASGAPRLRLTRGGGMYGKVFLATGEQQHTVAVKVTAASPDDLFPLSFEVELAGDFARAGLGYRPLTGFHGARGGDVPVSGVKTFLAGPDFAHAPPRVLHAVLGWFAMEPFDMTLASFVQARHRVEPESMERCKKGLVERLRTARDRRFVHGDLHLGNIGIRREGPPAQVAPGQQRQRASAKFCHFGRSYTLQLARAARAHLASELDLSPEAACAIGGVNDACTLCWFLFDAASEKPGTALRRAMIATLAVQLIEDTGLARYARAAAIHRADPAIKDALLATHAMLDSVDWKQLLRAGELERRWPDIRRTLEALYSECHRIPTTIYEAGSPARPAASAAALQIVS